MSDDLRSKLKAFAERMVNVAASCKNEEGAKLFLILPFFQFLGYDTQNPAEVCPEHAADFSEKYKNRVDFAIIKSGAPRIAVECKPVGAALKDDRGQLKSYFNAVLTIKMGVLTDGIVYEFYADSVEPNMMDHNPFLTLDMRELAKGKIDENIEDEIRSIQKDKFEPESVASEAKRKLILHNFVNQIGGFAEDPSEEFVRLLIQNVGLKYVKAKSLVEYRELAKVAFGEFLKSKNLQHPGPLATETQNWPTPLPQAMSPEAAGKDNDGLIASPLELAVYNYVKRRLAFLVTDDNLFEQIEGIDYKSYKGKFVVFFKKVQVGRLFDFYDEGDAKYNFDFDEMGGDVSTDKLADVDRLLLAVFLKRVSEVESPGKRLASTGR